MLQAADRISTLFSHPSIKSYAFDGNMVRIINRDGEPWFVAGDVCRVLEHTDASKAVSRLDEDEKGTNIVRTPSGNQTMLIINESGLYSLILTSRKPEARRFKKWVTSEVLPAIRKSGRYEASAPAELSASDQRLINRKAEDLSKKDFRRYQGELEQRCLTALAAGISVHEALASLPEKQALPPPPKARRNGIGCVYIDGKAVWFDMRDHALMQGGEALVLANYGAAPVADPLTVITAQPHDFSFMPFGNRTALQEEKAMEGGIGRIASYVIGRVIAVE